MVSTKLSVLAPKEVSEITEPEVRTHVNSTPLFELRKGGEICHICSCMYKLSLHGCRRHCYHWLSVWKETDDGSKREIYQLYSFRL